MELVTLKHVNTMPIEQRAKTSGDQELDCIGLAIESLSMELKNKIVRLAKSSSESNWASVDQVIQGLEAKEEALQTVGELLLAQDEAQGDILAALCRVQKKVSDLQAEKSGMLLQAWASLEHYDMVENALSLQIEALEAVGLELHKHTEWVLIGADEVPWQSEIWNQASTQGGGQESLNGTGEVFFAEDVEQVQVDVCGSSSQGFFSWALGY